jgi:hypothetical protein
MLVVLLLIESEFSGAVRHSIFFPIHYTGSNDGLRIALNVVTIELVSICIFSSVNSFLLRNLSLHLIIGQTEYKGLSMMMS